MKLTRRDFLKVSAGAGGLLIGIDLSACSDINNNSNLTKKSFEPNIWLRILSDNRIIITIAEMEMGQGVMTALPMLIAEELEADWNLIQIEQARLDPAYGYQITDGSNSISNAWKPLRLAGATAREMLRASAAKVWNVPLKECIARYSTIIHTSSGKQLPYGELITIATSIPIPEDIQLKTPEQFQIIGKEINRLDSPDIIDGSAVFGIDVKLPGLLTAAIKHCPTFGGKLDKYDSKETEKIKGIHKVVPLESAIAVIADNFWSATKGLDILTISWKQNHFSQINSEQFRKTLKEVFNTEGKIARSDGDAKSVISNSSETIQAEYELPFQAHATMEPMNCTAHVHDGICEIWVPTQTPSGAEAAAFNQAFSMPIKIWKKIKRRITSGQIESIKVHPTYIGGGFGRRLNSDYVEEAVQIAKSVNAPVKLIWSRNEDIQHDYYRPLSIHHLQAVLGEEGLPLAWSHRFAGPSVWPSGASSLPYSIPNIQVDFFSDDIGIPVGPWRSVAHSYNAFVTECFIDELAIKAKEDPVTYRLKLLSSEPRLQKVLELAADKADWGKSLPNGHYQGVAVHAAFGSYTAQIAEISISETGNIQVHRVICAFDCGIVVNPDTVRAQIEGGIIFGLTATIKSAISINNGTVVQSNFHDFPLLSMAETPEIDVHIMKNAEPPGGVGEPGVPPIAPAVVNAIFAATRIRVRKLPVVPGDLVISDR